MRVLTQKTSGANVAHDCQWCAACCFSLMPDYVRVWGIDYERLGDLAGQVTYALDNQYYLRMRHGHCAALRIDAITRRFACGVYEHRPDACRALERGSSACHAEIAEKAERPLSAIDALLAGDARS